MIDKLFLELLNEDIKNECTKYLNEINKIST